MTDPAAAGTYTLGDHTPKRVGYGAMQLAGDHVFGAPKDRAAAIAVLRAAVDAGVDHIDTSDFYGPHVVNEIIREALHPYPDGLVIVTKVGAVRGADASWNPAYSREELTTAVHHNLRNLGLDALDVVNLRMGTAGGKGDGPLDEALETLVGLKEQGLIRHIGLSNVAASHVARARAVTAIACVQNEYNLAHREDDALIDELAAAGIAYVPFFPLGGFSPLQSDTLSAVAVRLGRTPMQVALAWLLHRSPNILVIAGTSSVAHLRENLDVAGLALPVDALVELDTIGAPS